MNMFILPLLLCIRFMYTVIDSLFVCYVVEVSKFRCFITDGHHTCVLQQIISCVNTSKVALG